MNLGGSQNSSICRVKEALSLWSIPAQISSLDLGPQLTLAPLSLTEQFLFTPVWSFRMKPLYLIVCLPSPGCNTDCSWLPPFLAVGSSILDSIFPFSLCCNSWISPSTHGWVGFTDVFFSLIFFILKYIINVCKRSPDVFSARPSEP